MSSFWRGDVTPEFLNIDGQRLPLVIKRHRRAKRICLRYNPTQHAISLTLPRHTRVSDGLRFLTQKSEWLIETLRDMPVSKQIKPGVVIPLLGERVRIKHDPDLDGAWDLAGDTLSVAGGREFFPRRVTEALRAIAVTSLEEIAQRQARRIGRKITRVSVRDTRSRWGSCSSSSTLAFSWRLIFAPMEVMEYVVAHEVAHLRHMNHSAHFWELVGYLCPDYEAAKDWLRLHGKDLYRYKA
ncbi:MAG: SprT family zinc-dependent metalloprotease [Alphaproteobacteria bacterium]